MIFEPNIIIDDTPDYSQIIKVIGVGGAGCNAVNRMHEVGIKDVDLVVCNLDYDTLKKSKVKHQLQLGKNITKGLGAGFSAEVAQEAAKESEEAILKLLQTPTQMVFLTAGIGGGTGTGATPIIAAHAKKLGILTIAVVTSPFKNEGGAKIALANRTIEELRNICDAVLVIDNQRIFEIYLDDQTSDRAAYEKAHDVLVEAVKCIAELITITGEQNIDFNDVKAALTNTGQAMMGVGLAEGPDRGMKALEMALASPLLENCDISGAENVLINYTYSIEKNEYELKVFERKKITEEISRLIGISPERTKEGTVYDNTMGSALQIKIVAAGFKNFNPATPAEPVKPYEYTPYEYNEYAEAIMDAYKSMTKTSESFVKLDDEFEKIPAFTRMEVEMVSNDITNAGQGKQIKLF